MKKLLMIAALAAPVLASQLAFAQDDAAPKKTKHSSKHSKKTTKNMDGSATTEKTDTTKTEKPVDAPANP